jgi:two-component system NtrC family sensor kinase
MSSQHDVILIIDDDPEARSLLREQVLSARNFYVVEARDGSEGLIQLKAASPDLIVVDLELPGLTGRDLLVAIKSQGYHGPLIVVAESGSERTAIEAFRVGATDYITRPIREAEALAAIERGLAEVRLRRQRDSLTARLQASNQQLEARINELTTLYDIGQSVTAMRDLPQLFNRVLEGALSMTGADQAMLLLREDDKSGQMVLRAGKNLQLALLDRLGEPINDQLAELVTTSREVLTVDGEGLRRFGGTKDLYAVAYAPLIVQTTAIGALAVGNHQKHTSFTESQGRLLKALADYAAIAIVNGRLFSMLDQRARSMEAAYRELQARDAERGRQLQIVLTRLYQPLLKIETDLAQLAGGSEGKVPQTIAHRLMGLSQQVKQLALMITGMMQRPG